MNQVPFKTLKAEGVFVRVPDGEQYSHIRDTGDALHIVRVLGSTTPVTTIKPPSGLSLRGIGLTLDLTEQQWSEVVEESRWYGNSFRNYEADVADSHRGSQAPTATESGQSLMRSLGITEGEWVLILKR